MATLVVAGVGAYVGSGLTGIAAAASAVAFTAVGVAASYFDQKNVFPLLFGRDDSSSDRTIQQQQVRAREGAPIPIIYGVKNRVPGSLAWLGRINEQQSSVSAGGGKGGGSQTIFVKQYLQDGLVIFCKGPIAGWQRLYANSEVIYDFDLRNLVVGGPTYFWPYPGPIANGKVIDSVPLGPPSFGFRPRWAWIIRTDDEEQQLQMRRLLPGSRFTLSGISGGTFKSQGPIVSPVAPIDWTQTFEVTRIEGSDLEFIGLPTNTVHGGFLGEINDPQNITIASNFQINFTGSLFDTSKIATLDFTYGEGLNDPTNPLANAPWAPMVAEEGASRTPPYAGLAWVGYGQLNRNEFLNTFPLAVEAEIVGVGGAITVGKAIARILSEEAGLASTNFDVTKVSGDTLDGYSINGPQSAIQAVQPLIGAFDIVTQQDGETTRFISRKNIDVIDIPPEHIDSFDTGSPDEIARLQRQAAGKLPSSISVEFIDVDRDLEPGTVKVNWHIDKTGESANPLRVSFPISMTKSNARKIAWRLLRASRNQIQRVFVTLPPLYDYLAENDAIRFNYAGVDRTVLIQRIDQSVVNGLIRVEGIEDDLTAEDVLPEDFTPQRREGVDYGGMRMPSETFASIHSLPPLRDGDHLTGGVYAGFYNADPSSRFRGAIVYESPDLTPRQYTQRATRQNRDVCGITQTALPSATKSMLGVWDMSSTVDVQIFGGELESRGKDITAHGYEYAIVGSEVIRFAHAELIAANTYRLSQLIRGLRDTEDAALATHTVNEPFMLFSKSSGAFIPSDSGVRARRHWKVVSPGGDLAFALERTIESQDATLRPFSVGNLKATGSAGSNIEVSWVARTNRLTGTFSFPETDADSWIYEVKVEHGTAEQPPFLTTTVSQPSYSLTTGIQGTYEINPGTPLLISVRRLGTFSPSKWKSVTV